MATDLQQALDSIRASEVAITKKLNTLGDKMDDMQDHVDLCERVGVRKVNKFSRVLQVHNPTGYLLKRS